MAWARHVTIFDHAAAQVPPGAWMTEITFAVDRDIGPFDGGWPEDVKIDVRKTVTNWAARNADRAVLYKTTGCRNQDGQWLGVVLLHHTPKASAGDAPVAPLAAPAGEASGIASPAEPSLFAEAAI